MTPRISRMLALVFTLALVAPLAAQTKDKAMSMPMAKDAPAAKSAIEALAITFKTDPSPVKTGAIRFDVTVKDVAGKPVADADVSVTLVMAAMPAMNMPEMRKTTKLKATGGGMYSGSGE